MELISSVARRTRLGDIGYVLLNVAYAALLLGLLWIFNAPWLSYVLVVLSKWRIFAVRPRFWVANIKANALDTVLGLSVVTLIWQNSDYVAIQLGLTAAYVLWLVVVKPSSKHAAVLLQAGITQFFALWALFSVAYALPLFVVTLAAGFVGFVVAHHAVNIFAKEYEDMLLSLVWMTIIATLGWLTWYWTVAYTPLRIPQVSIVGSLLGFLALVAYQQLYSEEHNQTRPRRAVPVAPVAFVLIGIAVLLMSNFFDQTSF
ncbi:MAG: hypothetical protein ACM3MA_00070 [Acidobacteriota bacterium]